MVYTRSLIYFLPIADENFIITRVFIMIFCDLSILFLGSPVHKLLEIS